MKAFLKSLLLSAACVMIPGSHSAAQNQKTVEVTKGVNVTIPAPWFLANRTGNAVELAYPLQGREPRRKPEQKEKPTTGEELVTAAARIAVSIEQRRTHEEALERLGNIAAEQNERPELLVIAGWAAIHRKRTATLPNPGVEGTPAPQANALFTTTAIAVDTLIVRFETVIAPGSGPELADAAFDIARHVQVKAGNPDVAQRELEKVYGHPVAPTAPRPPSAGDTRRRAPSEMPAPGSTRVQGGVGELEVAVSNDGQHVVVAANSGYSFSDDGGQTFTSGGGTPCIYNRCDGDPSLAVGQSGAFYYSWIGRPFNQAGGTPANGWTDSLSRSTDNGHTYTFRSNAVFCPDTTPNVCTVPDQEHIAADRLTGPATGDRVYLVWRNFSNVGLTARIVCSSDGGGTWPTQQTVDTAGDFPRITVGPDGFVYVVYFLYSGANIIINLHKFSTCDSGLTPQAGFPVTVSTAASVPCPMPGLDRCNDGNILSSPTVAVDDLDAQHVYVAWAVSSGAGNENIIVADSVNGGTSFPRSIQVNSAATGRRFMPWVSSYGGVAYVNWYDRRNSTSANNDLTRYYGGPAAVKAGNLVAGTETDISQINDGQCSTWPCAPRSTNDSESCSAQPQLAGRCSHNPPVVGDSFQACDFTTGPACPGTETCLTGGGCPKYGDYNGGTAIAGRRYAAWASATPPPGVTGATSGINVYESSDVLPSDFFVRDWTVNATNHDLGPEPSTNPDFYTSSDVWNQRSSSTPASPVNDWVAGDADANAGGPAGNNNFAFVRVSRRAAASPNAPTINVPVTFLKADYGLGTNYVTVANASLTFNPTDLTKTLSPGIGWRLDAGASSHICLAAEINVLPGDPLLAPSLNGGAPGPNDPRIRQDNNKAQRNLGSVALTGGTSGAALYAIIHNPTIETRDMTLAYHVAEEVLKRLPGTRVGIVGGPEDDLRSSGRLVLKQMEPGEFRWFEVALGTFQGGEGDLLPISISETEGESPVNGFTVGIRPSSAKIALREALDRQEAVLSRFAVLLKEPRAEREAETVRELLRRKDLDENTLLSFVKEHIPAVLALLRPHFESGKFRSPYHRLLSQRFAVSSKALIEASYRSDTPALLGAHTAAFEQLNADLSTIQKAGGDSADILQMVRWQRLLFEKAPNFTSSREIVRASGKFIEDFESQAVTFKDYPSLLAGLMPAFKAAAGELGDDELAQAAARISASLSSQLGAVEKAHRDYLRHLASVLRKDTSK